MNRKTKLTIAILVVILIGIITFACGEIFFSGEDLSIGEKNILVCAIDESEPRPGMGACDMAFLVHMDDGGIKNYTPIYPHGMIHPNVAEPPEYQAAGAGSQLLLHDSFYWADNQLCMKYAKEILEYNTNYTADAVIAVNSEALDNIINSAGTLKVNGTEVDARGIDFIRLEQNAGGANRGDAVMAVTKALLKAVKDPDKRNNMVQTALSEYAKGHIAMYPEGIFNKFIASKGIRAVLS